MQDDDNKNDARGMAIKVIGVPGEKLLEDDRYATTRDFIMINHPMFFMNDPRRYLSFTKESSSDSLLSEPHTGDEGKLEGRRVEQREDF